MESTPASIRSVAPSIDANHATIVTGCFEKRPDDRPETAYALARALSDWLARFSG